MKRELNYLNNINVSEIKGFGEKRLTSLKKAGINSIVDLIRFYPRKHIDRSSILSIEDVRNLFEIKEITSKKKVEMPNGFEQIIGIYDDLMVGKWTSAYQNSDGALEHNPENITLHKMRLYAAFMEKDLEHFNKAWENSTMLFPFLDELTELSVAVTPFLMNSNKSSKNFLVLNESDWIGLIKAEGLRFTGDDTKSKALFNRLLIDPNISKPFIKKRINPNPIVK